MSILPPETPFTDLEQSLLEAEPPGLFPQNQDSYWGQLRKITSDKLQEVADLLAQYYLNMSVNTVNADDMDEWEQMLGIPVSSSTRTLEQRRPFALSRLAYGPFTNARRRAIVEAFILATFNPPILFTPEGIAFDGTGISFGNEISSLEGTYAIRENWPEKNLIQNALFTVDISDWVSTSSSGAIINDFSRTNAWSKFGGWSAHYKWTQPNDSVGRGAGIRTTSGAGGMPVSPDKTYTGSVYVKTVDPTSLVSSVQGYRLLIGWYQANGAASAIRINDVGALVADEGADGLRLVFTVTPPADAAFAAFFVQTLSSTPNDVSEFYVNAAQFEEGDTATDFSDPDGPPFYYEVRILDSLDVDVPGLERELRRITPAGIDFDITLTPTP